MRCRPAKIPTDGNTVWNARGAPHNATSFVWAGVKAGGHSSTEWRQSRLGPVLSSAVFSQE